MTPPRYRAAWDRRTVRNAAAIASYSGTLAGRTEALLDAAEFPVVLGGDCSILLGNALALRRSGRAGLAFLDGHLDFRHPGNARAVGAAAGEDLALVTGRGAPELVDIGGLRPYVRDEDVVALGFRSGDVYADEAAAAGIGLIDSAAVRRDPEAAAHDLLARIEPDAFWIHVDADVLDSALMPAVDSPEPDGLDYDELGVVLRVLAGDERARGLEVTIFDPDLDPDGSLAARLADTLVAALAR